MGSLLNVSECLKDVKVELEFLLSSQLTSALGLLNEGLRIFNIRRGQVRSSNAP